MYRGVRGKQRKGLGWLARSPDCLCLLGKYSKYKTSGGGGGYRVVCLMLQASYVGT